MTVNGSVTVWHYDENNETYARTVFEKCWVRHVDKSTREKDGTSISAALTVRIPISDEIGIYKGDYIRIGVSDGDTPIRGQDFTVCEIADNRNGINKHWRLSCER